MKIHTGSLSHPEGRFKTPDDEEIAGRCKPEAAPVQCSIGGRGYGSGISPGLCWGNADGGFLHRNGDEISCGHGSGYGSLEGESG